MAVGENIGIRPKIHRLEEPHRGQGDYAHDVGGRKFIAGQVVRLATPCLYQRHYPVQPALDRHLHWMVQRQSRTSYHHQAPNDRMEIAVGKVKPIKTGRKIRVIRPKPEPFKTLLSFGPSGSARGQPTAGRWQKPSRPDADAALTIRPAMFGPCG